MIIKKKPLLNAVVILTMTFTLLTLAACGGSSNASNSADETDTTPETTTPAPETPPSDTEGNDGSEPEEDTSSYQFEEPSVTGNTYYLDPINGSITGDGSESNPWSSLQEVLESNLIETFKHSVNGDPESTLITINEGAPIKGGDRLLLKDGYHGQLEIGNFYFTDWLTIEAAEGETPVLARLHLNGLIKHVYLKNLTITRDSYQGPENYWEAADMQRNSKALLYIGSNDFFGDASDVKVYGLTAMVSENVMSWSRQDWEDRYGNGINLRATSHVEVVNSAFENIGFGAVVDYFANNTTIVNSSFKNYCRDGVRLVAHDFLFENNIVAGVININTSADSAVNFHYDAFQTYSRDENNPNAGTGNGILRNAIIRGNQFIGATDLPLNNGFIVNQDVQGIGGFDGFFDNFIIENNIVSVNHHHGITLLGATNSKIVNNTVIDSQPMDHLHPWIRINNHKDGRESTDSIIANNIITQGAHVEGLSVVAANNYIIGSNNYDEGYSLFEDMDNNNYTLSSHPLVDENIVNAGQTFDSLYSSITDIEGTNRTGSPDLGAYER